jgi:hypothetical protein
MTHDLIILTEVVCSSDAYLSCDCEMQLVTEHVIQYDDNCTKCPHANAEFSPGMAAISKAGKLFPPIRQRWMSISHILFASAATSTPKSKASPLRTPSRVCPYMTSSSSFHAFSSSSSSSHQFCTASASALHCTSPTTLLNSSSVLPILTTEYLNILGSRPKVLRTACCVLALESKRTTK